MVINQQTKKNGNGNNLCITFDFSLAKDNHKLNDLPYSDVLFILYSVIIILCKH